MVVLYLKKYNTVQSDFIISFIKQKSESSYILIEPRCIFRMLEYEGSLFGCRWIANLIEIAFTNIIESELTDGRQYVSLSNESFCFKMIDFVQFTFIGETYGTTNSYDNEGNRNWWHCWTKLNMVEQKCSIGHRGIT